jgi:hypothetical protein
MKIYISYFFFFIILLLCYEADSQSVKPRITAVQSIADSPYGAPGSTIGNWNRADTWDLNRIPGHNDTIVIPDGITIRFVVSASQPGASNNRLTNAVVIVQNGGGISFWPVQNQGQGEKLFLECNSAMHVEPGGWLWGDQVGDKISHCNKYVWSGNGNQNFGPYTWGDYLPVELLYFKAEQKDNEIILKWATASETNNDFFLIERGNSPETFETIAMINGSGNSNIPVYYSYTDKSNESAIVYYRLSQFDYDGTNEQLGIIAVKHGERQQIIPIMFQNPVLSSDIVEIIPLNADSGLIEIFALCGEKVFSTAFHEETGKIQVSSLRPGMYIIHYVTPGTNYSAKLIVQ